MYEDDVRQIWHRYDALIKSCALIVSFGWVGINVFLSPNITDAPSTHIPQSILDRFTSVWACSVPYLLGNVLKRHNTSKYMRKICYIS